MNTQSLYMSESNIYSFILEKISRYNFNSTYLRLNIFLVKYWNTSNWFTVLWWQPLKKDLKLITEGFELLFGLKNRYKLEIENLSLKHRQLETTKG